MIGTLSKARLYGTNLTTAQMGSNFGAEASAYGLPSITFKANDGAATADTSQGILVGGTTVLAANTYTRTGYSFSGWNTAADGTGTSYSDGASISLSSATTLYAMWTLNAPSTPTITGTLKVGEVLTATPGTYSASGVTSSFEWKRSSNGSTWTPIPGATASTYTLVDADGAGYVRVYQTLRDGTRSAVSSVTSGLVLTENSQTSTSGGNSAVTDLIDAVPNDSGIYNVTVVSSNLANGKLKWASTPSNIAVVNGVDVSGNSYMPTAVYGSPASTWATAGYPILTFRGTGTDLRAALADLNYTSTSVQTDVLKIYVNTGSNTGHDVKNYIPIYDNGKLTFHYYTLKTQTAQSWTSTQSTLQATTTLDGVSSSNKWYLMTPRYWVEDDRGWKLTGAEGTSTASLVLLGGMSDNGSSTWYYPAGTDGYSSATNFSSGTTAQNGLYASWYNQDGGSSGDRGMQYWCNSCSMAGGSISGGGFGWDDIYRTTSQGAYIAETYSATPLNVGTSATAVQTVRTVTAPGVPTSLAVTTASASSVNLTWTAPSAGTDALTDYRVQWSTSSTFASDVNTVNRSASTTTSQVVTGLPKNTLVYFRVAAISSVTGSYSSTVSTTMPNAEAPTLSALAVGYTGSADTSVALTWAAPTTYNSSSITGYTVQYSTDQSSWTTVTRTSTPATSTYELITGLTANTPYYFRVTATLSSGTGLTSAVVSATTRSAATSITVVASGGGSGWIALSYGPSVTSATLSGLMNGTAYSVRVRAETTQPGAWSPVAGPFTPVAPPQPAVRTAPAPTASTPSTIASLLSSSVMPVLPTNVTITPLTGPKAVKITEDGRIELRPNQSVALVDGQPVQALVSLKAGQLQVQTETTQLSLGFGSPGNSSGSIGAPQTNGSAATVTHNTAIDLAGSGFSPEVPVVTWIQSDPIKLSEAVSSAAGSVNDTIVIPDSIELGHHTIQINSIDANGRVVSIIYGIEVTAENSVTATAGGSNSFAIIAHSWIWIVVGLILIAVLFAIVLLVRRARATKNDAE